MKWDWAVGFRKAVLLPLFVKLLSNNPREYHQVNAPAKSLRSSTRKFPPHMVKHAKARIGRR
jgi:hypothetical protein